MDSKEIGARLIKLRSGISQEKMAEDLGISVSAISMYEQGNRIPRDEIKLRIAKYFGVSVQELFFNQ